ncbi:hypothetical protein BWQ96_08356 [Gracilariopsis chorda]|uniref:Transmembrane protein 198 n=1 Tax=Gracilariopsis chorda TaxID=448386 RepID=A0A2V3III4_9FLOR|nr:hypothetical protein BWQ96_08356 [Gracilariopsis chorda]|eukprot:PXF41904.1 hypothetical protein BWQ96_08356 [Gracilariopsis chorda]
MAIVDSLSDSADSILSNFNTYAASHEDGIIALLLFVGVVVSFSGRVLLTPTVFLLGFIPSSTTITALALAYIQDKKPANPRIIGALAMLCAVAVGVLVGVIMLRLLFRIATFLLCAGFGAVIVLIVHLFLLEPSVGPNALIILYSIVILAALLAGLFSVSYPDTAIILGTSFDGAALAVFSLARFLGHRPKLLIQVPQGAQIPALWAIGYASATLLLGIFGAMTQRQVAVADAIIAAAAEKRDSTREHNESELPESLPTTEQQHLIPFHAEPPHTPPYEREPIHSPIGNSTYGAVDQDDSQYSVVHNIGAEPLPVSLDIIKNAKDAKGAQLPL